MCTYDYTPYTGCSEGEQHSYIQWMKCHKALENNRYCSRENSTEVEVLRKLSTNVISCPLHGPIAAQQPLLNALRPRASEENTSKRQFEEAESHQTRNTRRRRAPEKSFEQTPRKSALRRRPARDTPPDSSDSESSSEFSVRPRTADGVKRSGGRGHPERKSSMSRGGLHRRASSAELLPPARILPLPHGRSEVSLPLKVEPTTQAENEPKQSPPKSTLRIPGGKGIIGLPSSPDMLHRAKSESLLRQQEGESESLDSTVRSTFSPSSDNSPDHSSEQLPFSNGAARRGRRAGARSIRDRSVDTMMRRIDENAVDNSEAARQSTDYPRASISTSRSSATTSPEPNSDVSHPIVATTTSGAPIYKSQDPRPRLHTLQIPTPSSQSIRGISPASAASAAQQNTPHHSTPQSLRYGNSPAPSLNFNLNTSPQRNEDTSSIRSRRIEDQIAEGRRWAAARDHMTAINSPAVAASRGPLTDMLTHMSESHLPLVAPASHAGRESVDSGYRSGPGYQQHQRQRSRDVDGGKEKEGKRLQKAQPQAQGQEQEEQERTARVPAPAPLNLTGLPPCMLPISLFSPGFAPESDTSEVVLVGKAGKVSLRERMGLRRKFSGLLWDRNGQREVGVEG